MNDGCIDIDIDAAFAAFPDSLPSWCIYTDRTRFTRITRRNEGIIDYPARACERCA